MPGRNVGLQEVKNCLRLLDNSGEGLHRQALLEGCLVSIPGPQEKCTLCKVVDDVRFTLLCCAAQELNIKGGMS